MTAQTSPRPTPVAVQLDGVGKRFATHIALQPLSLAIHQGELLALLGPSGCGKSTLLKLIAGTLQADQGEIFIDGQRVTEAPLRQRGVAVVDQPIGLGEACAQRSTAAQWVGAMLAHVSPGELGVRVEQALAQVQLSSHGACVLRELSAGQQQRVALARALVTRPRVLLLDEPFATLDRPLRLALQGELKHLQRTLGLTTLLVTHDQQEALGLSDRLAVMSAGRLHQVGRPDILYRYPADPFVAAFVGDVNVLSGRCVSRDPRASRAPRVNLELGNSPLRVPAERVHAEVGARIDLYVRPEHIRLGPLTARSQLSATVVAHVFQGDHVDIHLDVPALGQARLCVRQSGLDALARWPTGAVAGVTFDSDGVSAFASRTA